MTCLVTIMGKGKERKLSHCSGLPIEEANLGFESSLQCNPKGGRLFLVVKDAGGAIVAPPMFDHFWRLLFSFNFKNQHLI